MSETKEIADGVNMDITSIREKFQEHLKELRSMQSQMIDGISFDPGQPKSAILPKEQYKIPGVEGKAT
jgi:hypothetical protein